MNVRGACVWPEGARVVPERQCVYEFVTFGKYEYKLKMPPNPNPPSDVTKTTKAKSERVIKTLNKHPFRRARRMVKSGVACPKCRTAEASWEASAASLYKHGGEETQCYADGASCEMLNCLHKLGPEERLLRCCGCK